MLLNAFASILLIGSLCHSDGEVVPWTRLVPAQRINPSDTFHYQSHHAFNETIHAAWQIFKVKFQRTFTHSVEHMKRFEIFAVNFMKAHYHNQKFRDGKANYQMIMNEFSDRTPTEIQKMKCLWIPKRYPRLGSTYEMEPVDLPESIDWREHGAVTPVKNQGNCGSCWAFSSTGAIEGHYFRAKQSLMSFSEQQLVDCSVEFGNNGCDGGFMDNAFKYIQESHGLNSEEEYPYVSGNTSKPNPFCYFNKSFPHVRVTGYVDLQQYSEEMLMHAVATKGPVSVAINAAESFQFYHSGVYSDENCIGDQEHLNHGVLVVGYGKENGIPYWLIKNSWGPNWGERGYVKILRNSSNMCGVATLPSYPLVTPVSSINL